MGRARRGGFSGYRVLYIYGGAIMTDSELKDFNEHVYNHKCKTCRRWKDCYCGKKKVLGTFRYCFYGKKKRTDTCYGLFYIADKRKLPKKACFLCKRKYFVDDPEFNAEKCICDNCAEQLERDNPYNGFNHDNNNE